MELRWSILLPLVHVAIAVAVIAPEELRDWHEFYSRQRYQEHDEAYRIHRKQERARRHRMLAEGPGRLGINRGEPDEFSPMAIDCWPSSAERTMHFVNFPADLVVGWYQPAWCRLYPLLWPVLGLAADSMRLGTRMIVLDVLFVATVALQWWLMGRLIEVQRKEKGVTPSWTKVVLVITYSGLICALLTQFRRGTTDFFVNLGVLVASFAWLVLAFLAAVKLVRWSFSRIKGMIWRPS